MIPRAKLWERIEKTLVPTHENNIVKKIMKLELCMLIPPFLLPFFVLGSGEPCFYQPMHMGSNLFHSSHIVLNIVLSLHAFLSQSQCALLKATFIHKILKH